MFDKMKQIMEMKKQADKIKRELDNVIVESEVVSGIKISLNGSQQFKSVEIQEDHLNAANKNKFETDLLVSINAAIQKSQAEAAAKMKDAMLPGM